MSSAAAHNLMEGISYMDQENKLTRKEILNKINKLDRKMMKISGLGALVIGKEIEELTEQYRKATN